MSFGEQLRHRREELGLTRDTLAERLGLSRSAIGNYETDIAFPKEEVLLKLFNALEVDPNYLFRGSYRHSFLCSEGEQHLIEQYRALPQAARQTVRAVMEGFMQVQRESEGEKPVREKRMIPLYASPAAAGFAAPVFMEDYELIEVTDEVPPAADMAVRIQGDSMEPYITDGSVVYVNHDPLQSGDVGIFCVDGEMLCKQYHRDALGVVYLFSLNRRRSDLDVVFYSGSGRSITCFGRVMIHGLPIPE
ncbi:MAG: LexA family transcriptional regulator [Oscillospiraceae bacterium]|nr:LexA family transcriptional regulator [Oscillospiraceae bacterium]